MCSLDDDNDRLGVQGNTVGTVPRQVLTHRC